MFLGDIELSTEKTAGKVVGNLIHLRKMLNSSQDLMMVL